MFNAAITSGFHTDANLNDATVGETVRVTWKFLNLGTNPLQDGYTFGISPRQHIFNRQYTESDFGVTSRLVWDDFASHAVVGLFRELECTVTLTMPAEPGTYVSHWQLYSPSGRPFGSLRHVRFVVNAAPDNLPPPPPIDGSKFVSFTPGIRLDQLKTRERFTATWTLRNTGATTWNGNYTLRHVSPNEANVDMPNEVLATRPALPLAEIADHLPVPPDDTVRLTLPMKAPATAGLIATHWQIHDDDGDPFGGKLWARAQVAARPRPRLHVGMNINPDQIVSNPLASGALDGIAWTRYPVKVVAKYRTLDEAFIEYDKLIADYAERGIRTLLILNQETEWGPNAPWDEKNTAATWAAYSENLAAMATRIAERYAHLGDGVAYQIWNEGDNRLTPYVSIYVPPADYAHMLTTVTAAIRLHSNEAPIIGMGMSTGPDSAIDYAKQVRTALGDVWPIDALAVHPYGRWFSHRPFENWGFGTLDQYLTQLEATFPEIPFWITEIGVPGGARPIEGDEQWHSIGAYLEDIFANIERNHVAHVPVCIWFAWSDLMDNAGIVQADGSPKPGLGEAFGRIRDGLFMT